MNASLPPPLALEEGTVLAGKYRLDRVAGFGGMAQLWVATNQSTSAEVCIKILPEGADEEASERFRREAYAAARLSHRAIVRVFDLVEIDGRGPRPGRAQALAIVMELLHGETLGDLLMKRGALPVEEALDIAVPVVSALAHAHRAGVVHRDLKPDNVFLARDPDGKVIPKVLDFGVSKVQDGLPLTQDGVILGTPSFMSPEQARGALNVDARSDVFAAGILLYTMVAGKNPFEADSFSASVSAVLEREPPRLPEMGDALWEVLSKALSKKAADRYRDATELGIALRYATGRTTIAESGTFAATRATTDSEISVPPVTRTSVPVLPPYAFEPAASTQELARSLVRPGPRPLPYVIGGAVALAGLALVVLLRGSPAPPPAAAKMDHGPAAAASIAPVPQELAVAPVAPAPVAERAAAEAPAPPASASAAKPEPTAAKPAPKPPTKKVGIAVDPGF